MNRLTATNRLNDGGRHIVENPQAADLDIPLTNSIIPQRGIGAVTYTRATIASVTDHEGVIRQCISGEARFQGARRVQNLFSYSEDASNAYWNKVRASVTANAIAGPSGNLVADLVVGTTAGGSYIYAPMSVIAGNKYRVSVCVKAADVTNFNIKSFTQPGECVFDLALAIPAAPTGIASSPTITNLGNGWWRCSLLLTASATGSNNIGCISQSYVGNICYVCEMQMEDVTGQSDTSFGGYVSTNVLTSTPFHGANVDGVKYFNTTLSGATIPASILKGYLAESSKNNLFLQSEDFSSISWSKNNGSVVANFALSPNGYTDADKFVPTAGTSQSYLTQAVTVTASIYTISFYIKSAGKQFVQMNASDSISNGYVNFDIVNGVVGSSSLWSGYIEAVAGFPGMYRCSITTETVTAGTGNFSLFVVDSNSAARGATSVNNGSDSIIVWGAQFELGDFPSSYIPTTTATVTRNTDSLSYSSSNVVDSQGAAYVEASLILPGNTSSSLSSRFLVTRGANGRMFYISSAINSINNYDGTNVLLSNPGPSMNGNIVKMASSWSGSTKDIYYGTTTPKSGTFDGTMGTGNIDVGATWNGTIRNLKIWKTPPTVAELTSITTL